MSLQCHQGAWHGGSGAWELKKHKNYMAPRHVLPSWPLSLSTCPPPHSLSGPAFTTDDNMASQLLNIIIMTTQASTSATAPVSTVVPACLGQHGQAGAEEQRNGEKVDRAPAGSLTWARGLT